MISADNQQSASLASMIMSGEGCWAEEGYTRGLLEDMGTGTDLVSLDSRFSFLMEPIQKNGLTLYPCSKHSWQDGEITSISPVIFRLSEMYLNRAEAYAKTSQTDKALADVNEIRTHRIDAAGWNIPVYCADRRDNNLDLVLKDHRVEFSFWKPTGLIYSKRKDIAELLGFQILTYTPVFHFYLPRGRIPGSLRPIITTAYFPHTEQELEINLPLLTNPR
jgi:hypothetical protein